MNREQHAKNGNTTISKKRYKNTVLEDIHNELGREGIMRLFSRKCLLHSYRKTEPNVTPKQFTVIYDIWCRRQFNVPHIYQAYQEYSKLALADPCLVYTGGYSSELYPCFNMNKKEYHIKRDGVDEMRVVLPLHQIRDYYRRSEDSSSLFPEILKNKNLSFNHSCNTKRCVVHASVSTREKNLSETFCPVYSIIDGHVVSVCNHLVKCIDINYIYYINVFQ